MMVAFRSTDLSNKGCCVVKSKDMPFDEAACDEGKTRICEAQKSNDVEYAATIVGGHRGPAIAGVYWSGSRHSGKTTAADGARGT